MEKWQTSYHWNAAIMKRNLLCDCPTLEAAREGSGIFTDILFGAMQSGYNQLNNVFALQCSTFSYFS